MAIPTRLNRVLPTHFNPNLPHSNDVDIFLNGQQIVPPGQFGPYWNEINTAKGQGLRVGYFSAEARWVFGKFEAKWSAAYQAKLDAEEAADRKLFAELLGPNPIYFSVGGDEVKWPFAFTQEAQVSYRTTPAFAKGKDFQSTSDERKMETMTFKTSGDLSMGWCPSNVLDITQSGKADTGWNAEDDEMVADMLTAGRGSKCWGYVMMPDGHMSHVCGTYRGALNEECHYAAWDVYRDKGQFRVVLKDDKGVHDRRFNLYSLGAGKSTPIIKALNSRIRALEMVRDAKVNNITTLLAQIKVLESQSATKTETILRQREEIGKLHSLIGAAKDGFVKIRDARTPWITSDYVKFTDFARQIANDIIAKL